MIHAVLFDLDGTLLDTALDLTVALNRLLAEEQLPLLAVEAVRPFAGQGARGILQRIPAWNNDRNVLEHKLMRYLAIYGECLTATTRFFDGVEQVLRSLDERDIPWGIVTNKRACFTEVICKFFQPLHTASCVVSGDTLAWQKPHPAPVLYATSLLQQPPEHCIFVGDSLNDVLAANRAGMPCYVAAYGYITPDESINEWPAAGIIHDPQELITLLQQ